MIDIPQSNTDRHLAEGLGVGIYRFFRSSNVVEIYVRPTRVSTHGPSDYRVVKSMIQSNIIILFSLISSANFTPAEVLLGTEFPFSTSWQLTVSVVMILWKKWLAFSRFILTVSIGCCHVRKTKKRASRNCQMWVADKSHQKPEALQN